MKQKLFHGIVLLFLIYTAVELAFPQFCREKSISVLGADSVVLATEQPSLNKTSALTQESIARNSDESLPKTPSRDSNVPDNDDCFCCCAHVVPSPLFVNPETSVLVVPSGLQHPVSIPTASLRAPYHPPRSA